MSIAIPLAASASYPEAGKPDARSADTGRFFQEDSTWYTKIPDNPALRPDSAEVVRHVAKTQPTLAAHNPTLEFPGEWSVSVWYAVEGTPSITVRTRSAFSADRGWNVVPIPAEAVPTGNDAALADPDKYIRDGSTVIISEDKLVFPVPRLGCLWAAGHTTGGW
jgi:hypothetical protein